MDKRIWMSWTAIVHLLFDS